MRYDISEATCDAAGTYELSDVDASSQGGDTRSGHASSVDRIHCYSKGCKVSRLFLDEYVFIVLYLALL